MSLKGAAHAYETISGSLHLLFTFLTSFCADDDQVANGLVGTRLAARDLPSLYYLTMKLSTAVSALCIASASAFAPTSSAPQVRCCKRWWDVMISPVFSLIDDSNHDLSVSS
jgi:hypothetical protein